MEEYYIGGLFLGIGNGVTDASVALIGLFIFTGYFGNDVFKTLIPLGYGNFRPFGEHATMPFNYLLGYAINAS